MTSSSFAWLKWIGGSRPGSYLDTYLPYLYSTQYQSMLTGRIFCQVGFLSIAATTPKSIYSILYNLTSAYPAISTLSKRRL